MVTKIFFPQQKYVIVELDFVMKIVKIMAHKATIKSDKYVKESSTMFSAFDLIALKLGIPSCSSVDDSSVPDEDIMAGSSPETTFLVRIKLNIY